MKITSIFLVRHGESIYGEERLCGWSDVPLSDIGREQARVLALRLKDVDLKRILCSDRERTIETADIINIYHSLPIEVIPEIRELNYGLWEGKSWKEIEEEFPEAYKEWREDNTLATPEGESPLDVYNRVRCKMEEIVSRSTGENILIVAHKSVNRILICKILGGDLKNYRIIGQDNCALNIIKYYDGFPVIERINDTGVV
jgi:broad specificity phosphatase PhoE